MAHFFVLVLKAEETAKSVEVRERFDYCFEIIRKENNKDRKGMFFFFIYISCSLHLQDNEIKAE